MDCRHCILESLLTDSRGHLLPFTSIETSLTLRKGVTQNAFALTFLVRCPTQRRQHHIIEKYVGAGGNKPIAAIFPSWSVFLEMVHKFNAGPMRPCVG